MRTLSLSILLATTGCAGGVAHRDATPIDHAERRVERALREATGEANRLDGLALSARYAPAPCACPQWEVRVGDRWQRVALRGAPEIDEDTPAGTTFMIIVDGTNDTVGGENGWRYRVLEVLGD